MTSNPETKQSEDYQPYTDMDAITAYNLEQQFKEQLLAQQPLVSDKQPITTLIKEFSSQKNYTRQIQKIIDCKTHIDYREMRRDGDCFYRSFLLGLFEYIEHTRDAKLLSSICEIVTPSLYNLLKYGFEDYTLEEFYLAFMDELQFYQKKIEIGDEFKANDGIGENAVERMSNNGHTNYLIFWARMLTSLHIRDNQPSFAPFIPGGKLFGEWLQCDVEALHCEADHLQFTALSQAIKVPITVVCLENNENKNGPQIVNSMENEKSVFDLLYRPGHYDILYRDDEYNENLSKLQNICNVESVDEDGGGGNGGDYVDGNGESVDGNGGNGDCNIIGSEDNSNKCCVVDDDCKQNDDVDDVMVDDVMLNNGNIVFKDSNYIPEPPKPI